MRASSENRQASSQTVAYPRQGEDRAPAFIPSLPSAFPAIDLRRLGLRFPLGQDLRYGSLGLS